MHRPHSGKPGKTRGGPEATLSKKVVENLDAAVCLAGRSKRESSDAVTKRWQAIALQR
jgi:hypothetical protein